MGSSLQNQMTGLATKIDKISEWSGRFISWLTLLMVLLVFVIVIMRYLFNMGSIQLQETVTYLHGMVFLLGAAYTLQQDKQVRVDVFYSSMSHKNRARVDLIGTLLLLFPVCIYIFSMSLDYVLLSWRINEASGETGGLPSLYLLKSLLLIMPLMMMLQGLANLIRYISFLFATGPSPYLKSNSKSNPSSGEMK
ncbi:MAG: C4-dicarboxylate ABC transporter permease [Gammaproteobacteria bacterium]|nr:MAG: C4-dicarboxylate ABC transporter permease [Gammaproteobacteria bacterium]